MSSPATQQPSPLLFFQTVNAYQRTAALKAGIELDVFTAIAEGNVTSEAIAKRSKASERGTRILCDYLSIIGFLNKSDGNYALTQDSAVFLDRRSPAYLGGALEFILTPALTDNFQNFAETVRKGGTLAPEGGTISPENPIWVKFARGMAPMAAMPAKNIANLLDPSANQKLKILDIAAGHGLYGIAFAEKNPLVEVVAVDWPGVLAVAKENARRAGVAERYSTIEGSAFNAEFRSGYDIVLLTNFLHHFDVQTCEDLLKNIHASLKEGGRVVTVEFVPNEDRISPPDAAAFSVMMLAGTPSGDAYTFSQLEKMFTNAGFSQSEVHPLPASIQQVVISKK